MKLLVLGGTGFLGPHFAQAARACGHEVTLFNRGKRASAPPDGVEILLGDRAIPSSEPGGLSALRGRRWDAVIDDCGYVPRIVRQSAEMLADSVDRYGFVSSISVYADSSAPGLDESAEMLRLPADEADSEEAVEGKLTGIFNATGPDYRLTMRAMLEACRAASGRGDITLRWMSWPELEAAGVAPWSDMPAWIPSVGESAGIGTVNCARAIAAGLTYRPIVDSARDTLAWWRSLPSERRASPKAGLSQEREVELLK